MKRFIYTTFGGFVALALVACASPKPPKRADSFSVTPPGNSTPSGAHIPPPPDRPAELANQTYAELTAAIDVKSIDGAIVPVDVWPPAYPEELEGKGVRGVVDIGFIVEKDGTVRDAWVIGSAHPALERVCWSAVRSWRFKPMTKDGKPVRVKMKQRFNMET